MKIKDITLVILGIIVLGLLFTNNKYVNTINRQNDIINTYNEYYNHSEVLLDSICSMKPYHFYDCVMETDTYYYYECSRDSIDKLLNNNLNK